MSELDAILATVKREVEKAQAKFAPMNGPHEGYADELWSEVKGNRGREDSAFDEAVQIAAMAVRYIADLNGDEPRK